MARKSKANVKEYLPWIEKYRPKKMDDIAHQSHVISTLRKNIESANLPHLLFYGPAGTGKTSTIIALSRQLFGPLMKVRVLELNASDERGINVVRTKIKSFAQYTVNSSNFKAKPTNTNTNANKKGANKSESESYPCPPYKIIILDEADSMTRDAQTALRRTMEKYSNVTRFCLICNYVSRIIAPVASRCAKFRFECLSVDSMRKKLTEIVCKEHLRLAVVGEGGRDVLDEVISLSGGDMRKAINLLQSASMMKCKTRGVGVGMGMGNGAMRDAGDCIELADIECVSVRVPECVIADRIMGACKQETFDGVNAVAHWIIAEGYPVSLVLSKLLDWIIRAKDEFANLSKAEIALRIAQSDKKLCDGASEFLQLLSVLGCVHRNAIAYKRTKSPAVEDEKTLE